MRYAYAIVFQLDPAVPKPWHIKISQFDDNGKFQYHMLAQQTFADEIWAKEFKKRLDSAVVVEVSSRKLN
jgi:hypothetical protein